MYLEKAFSNPHPKEQDEERELFIRFLTLAAPDPEGMAMVSFFVIKKIGLF